MDYKEAEGVEKPEKNTPPGVDSGNTSGNYHGQFLADLRQTISIIQNSTRENPVVIFSECFDLGNTLHIGYPHANQMLIEAARTKQAPGDVITMAKAGYKTEQIWVAIRQRSLAWHAREAGLEDEVKKEGGRVPSPADLLMNKEKEKKDKPAHYLTDRERRKQMIRGRMRRSASRTRPKRKCIHRKRCDTMRHLNVLI